MDGCALLRSPEEFHSEYAQSPANLSRRSSGGPGSDERSNGLHRNEQVQRSTEKVTQVQPGTVPVRLELSAYKGVPSSIPDQSDPNTSSFQTSDTEGIGFYGIEELQGCSSCNS